MHLQSFKEILLKKSVGNKNLQTMIISIEEENLLSHVVEALEKMARPTNNTGVRANPAVVSYAQHLTKTDVAQLRDALSHHISHYRAALKAHHSAEDELEKAKLRQVADQHLNHLIPLMHLAAKASTHSNGKLAIDYPPVSPWEVNYTTIDRRPETGKYIHDNKKLARRPSPNATKWSEKDPTRRGVPDYHYLEMPPHHGHEKWDSMPHEGGYPWEEIQLGDSTAVDRKEAHLHISDDIQDKKEYTPHAFDHHPIYKGGLHDVQADHLSPQRLEQFAADKAAWVDSEHHKNWLQSQREAHAKDPEGYKNRGKVKPGHVYDGIPLQKQLGHVFQHPKREKKGAFAVAKQLEAMKNRREGAAAPIAAAPTAVAPTVNKPDTASAAAPVKPTPAMPAVKPGMSRDEVSAALAAIRARREQPAAPTTPASAPQPAAPTPPPAAAPVEPHPLESTYQHYKSLPDGHSMKEFYSKHPEFMAYVKSKEGQ